MYLGVIMIGIIFYMSNLIQSSGSSRYDYIIVGAGSAGCTLANRLSEDNFAKVLLLEAGEKPTTQTEIPILLGLFLTGTSINWNYTIEPNGLSCLGAVNNSCDYFMGKTLGGSSQINYMFHARGNKKDYDLWAEHGADGWSYDEVLPFFKKAEKVIISPSIIDEDYRGKYGPLTISKNQHSTKLESAYLSATEELGFKTRDYNGKFQKGFGIVQLNARNGYRCSAEKAYLQPAYSRPNLKVITGALVTKVIIDQSKVATGVIYVKNGKRHIVKAEREVIVSAGVIKSPQLLMLSGVGPKEHLDKFEIKVLADLPVGKNLQDHIGTSALSYTVNEDTILTFNEVIKLASQISNHFPEKLTGVQSTPSLLEVNGFAKSPYETIDGDYNDLQFFFITQILPNPFYSQKILSFFKKYYDKPVFAVVTAILHPKSRGHVTLKSTDPTVAPRIVMNFLEHPRDMEVLLYGLKTARKLVETTKAFSKYQPKLVGPFPGCRKHIITSDEYLVCIARLLTESLYHGCGTCKMGRVHDKTTVVDSSLRVKKIRHLRVVDASIMPILVSANTNAPTIMIAEKAADIIKKQYLGKSNPK